MCVPRLHPASTHYAHTNDRDCNEDSVPLTPGGYLHVVHRQIVHSHPQLYTYTQVSRESNVRGIAVIGDVQPIM
jgi:hypothetical protein